MLKLKMNNGIKKAIDFFEDQRGLAKKLKVTQQAVSRWLLDVQKPPATRAIKIEKITKGAITRAEIRPDIFG